MMTRYDKYLDKSFLVKPKAFLFFCLVLSALLPYITTSSLTSNTQPHYLYFITLILFFVSVFSYKVPMTAFMVIVSVAYGGMALMLGASVKDMVSILFFFISFSLYGLYGVRYLDLIRLAVAISVVVYFVFCLFELVLGRAVIDLFVAGSKTSESRGLTSLSSEPSFLGIVSFSQIVLLQIIQGRRYRLLQSLAFMSLLLSASVAVIAPAFMVFIIYYISQYGFKGFTIITILLLVATLLIVNSGERAYTLFQLMLSNPSGLLLDQSVANRIVRSFGPIYVAIIDGFSPHDFQNLSENLSDVGEALGVPHADPVERLSNISTYMLYGFGYLSFPLILLYAYFVIHARTPWYLIAAIIYLLVTNISFATPYVSLLMASPAWFRTGLSGGDSGFLHGLNFRTNS